MADDIRYESSILLREVSMSLKGLLVRLGIAAFLAIASTIIYELVTNVLLRRTSNSMVTSQLTNSPTASTATTLFFSLSFGLLILVYLAALSYAGYNTYRYLKDKGAI